MKYKIKSAEMEFGQDGELVCIVTTAEMPFNCDDVRKIEARRSNSYWLRDFEALDAVLQPVLQKTTGHGSEVIE